jgi:hypothetical protein
MNEYIVMDLCRIDSTVLAQGFLRSVQSKHAQRFATVGWGRSQIQDSLDTNNIGMAEAFPVTASSSGQVNYLSLYLDNSSTAGAISVGLYTNYYSRPKTLLSQAVITQPVAGRWNPSADSGGASDARKTLLGGLARFEWPD